MEYEFVVAHDDQQPQQYQPQVSPNSAAFLALPDDSGPFLFSSDSSSSNHSISSNSPPNDWGTTWSEQDQLLDYSSHFHSAGIDPTQLHSFDLSFTSQNYVDLLNATFPAQPTVIQPGVLLQKPNPSLTVQSQTTQLVTPVTPITEDLNMAVKRLVGITSARIPGQYEPQLLQSSPEVTLTVPVSHIPTSTSSTYMGPSHPPPPSSSGALSSQPSPGPQQVGPSGRPKTAHTTIERRYRTNLNTCIIGLRNAIPAVRFLDKAFKPPSDISDVIDENGCIDGVKCARKISKATILSKAREYITVLKKRETKLSHELEGIKSLVSSLIGGPALLEEWERQWTAKYSQDEAMEVEGPEDLESGDDEDDDASGDERPRKRSKTSNIPISAPKGKKSARNSVAVSMEPIVPRPRAESPSARPSKKRGRPTKAMATQRASAQTEDPTLTSQYASAQMFTFVPPQSQPAQAQPAQQQMRPAYLLASFAFLSFFKPSNTVHIEHVHHDSGAVLSPLIQRTAPTFLGIKTDALHHFLHTLVMLGVFIALIATALPSLKAVFGFKAPAGSVQDPKAEKEESSEEEYTAHVTLGERTSSVTMAEETLRLINCDNITRKKAIARLQTVVETNPTAEELGLLALLEYSNQPVHAAKLWTQAKDVLSPSTFSPFHLAFDLPIETAVEIVLKTESQPTSEHHSPLLAIASKAFEARLGKAIQQSFVDEVDTICGINSSLDDATLTKSREMRVQLTAMARKLGGRSALLADEWEVALAGRWPKSKLGTEFASSCPSGAIIHAVGLIRRVFPLTFKDGVSMIGMIPSPPPSPLMQDEISRMERELRVTLGSSVFYDFEPHTCGENVARARDAVISRMTSVARMRRSLAVDQCE